MGTYGSTVGVQYSRTLDGTVQQPIPTQQIGSLDAMPAMNTTMPSNLHCYGRISSRSAPLPHSISTVVPSKFPKLPRKRQAIQPPAFKAPLALFNVLVLRCTSKTNEKPGVPSHRLVHPHYLTAFRPLTMVTMVAVGVLLIAAGPSLAIWSVMLQRRAHLLVVSILAAFSWCLAMMIAGTIRVAIPPIKNFFGLVIFIAVSMQELLRFALFYVFRIMARRGDGVEAFLRPGAKNEVLSGLSVGVGYALMSVLIQFYSLVADEFSDDTAIYIPDCPINFFVAAGAFSLAFSILHIFLGVLVWPAYSDDQGWDKILLGYGLHLGIAELSLLNQRPGGCAWNLGLTWAIIVLASLGIMLASRRRVRNDRE